MSHSMFALVAVASLAAPQAFAQEPSPPPLPTATPAVTLATDSSFGVHAAANLGLLSADYQSGHLYLFAAANLGLPLATNGQVGGFSAGAAYAIPLSQPGESMWFMDGLALATPIWTGGRPVVGAGVGVGFRYLHRSGFSFAAKVPVLGLSISSAATSTSSSLAYFYLANLVALPIISVGYRF